MPHILADFRTALLYLIVLIPLGGCGVFHDAYRPIPVAGTGESEILLPAGDYQLMSVRPQPGADTPIICTEPSPDFATALGTKVGIKAKGSASAGPIASLHATGQTTEAITTMLGRTAGVVALRDGLYAACQAYANGVIGKDAYALIISQYGNLLIMVVHGGAKSQAVAGPTIQVMRQQMLQAMLVACVTDQDPTRSDVISQSSRRGSSSLLRARNPLLMTYCPSFMGSVDAYAYALSRRGLGQINTKINKHDQ